jgi:hypothetical protein
LTGDTSSDGLSAAAGSEQGDLIHGGDGNDFIDGGVGHDELYGEAGNDTVYGSAGNDFVTGGAGADFLNGGDGNDTVLGSGTRVEFVWETESSWKSTFGYYDPATDKGKILLPNTDAHTGALNFETVLNVPAGVEFFVVPDGYNQTFASGKILAGQNGVMREIEVVYSGGAYKIRDVETGNFLRGKFQNGAVKEGAYYSDVDLNIDNKDHEKYVDGKTKWNTAYNAPGYPDDLVFNIKDVDLGGSGNDTIYGGNGSDVLDGGGGNDKLFGDAGSDVFILSPGSGNDTVGDYADGADKIYVANSFSQISITSQSGGTLVKLGSDSLFLSGVAKSKVTSGDFILKPEGLPISGPSGDSANTGLLVNQITGTSGADALVGTAAADNIQGYAGNDRLDGLAGNDSLFGGAGDDTLLGQVGDDFIDGGADYDRVWYGGPFADFAITFNGTTGFFEYIGANPSFAGTDTIVNVERFGFGDTSYSINDLKAQTGGSSSPPAITSDWFETFDDLSDGATKDTGDTAWSTDVSSAKINPIHGVTAGEYMFSQGSGPDQDDSFITWRSESIIFENVTDLEISFDLASSQGGNGMENSGSLHDFFQLFAIVDGGAPQLLLDQNGNVSGGSNSFKFTGITGREVEIEIHAKTTGSNEAYLLDDVHVSGDADLLI